MEGARERSTPAEEGVEAGFAGDAFILVGVARVVRLAAVLSGRREVGQRDRGRKGSGRFESDLLHVPHLQCRV